jgi:hypothetical protein
MPKAKSFCSSLAAWQVSGRSEPSSEKRTSLPVWRMAILHVGSEGPKPLAKIDQYYQTSGRISRVIAGT